MICKSNRLDQCEWDLWSNFSVIFFDQSTTISPYPRRFDHVEVSRWDRNRTLRFACRFDRYAVLLSGKVYGANAITVSIQLVSIGWHLLGVSIYCLVYLSISRDISILFLNSNDIYFSISFYIFIFFISISSDCPLFVFSKYLPQLEVSRTFWQELFTSPQE